MKNFNGVLVTYKPEGISSTDVVRIARKKLNMKKIGHTGTLDLLAEGVLVLCLGRATKTIEYLQEEEKIYITTMKLGLTTDTLDREGTIIGESKKIVEEDELRKVLEKYKGNISQVPPMYSALKYKGKRLYELAREGIEVERKSRNIYIYDNELLDFDKTQQLATIRFNVSSGTYIRTLVADIGNDLDSCAYMTYLKRIQCSGITLDQAIDLESYEDEQLPSKILEMNEILTTWPKIKVNIDEAQRLLNGMTIHYSDNYDNRLYRIFDQNNHLIGLGEVKSGEKGQLLKLVKHLKIN